MRSMVRALVRVLPLVSLATLAGCKGTRESVAAESAALVQSQSASVSESRKTAITRAVERVAPAVVTIQTEQVERVQRDPLFEWFYGRSQTPRVVPGLGSGFIVRGDGVIVTNAHVVANANRVSVMRRDGTVDSAEVLGTDETNDIAVLKIDRTGLPVAALGNSSAALIGEWAIAIGNPYGFVLGNSEPTVTAGVISGVGRNLVARTEGPTANFDLIQTDASINPGNSGGPLFNERGEVIGVNTLIVTRNGGSVGLGFSIMAPDVVRAVQQFAATGNIASGRIGVIINLSDPFKPEAGLLIEHIRPGSGAAAAGLQRGDLIIGMGGRSLIASGEQAAQGMAAVLAQTVPGQKVPVTVLRGDQTVTVEVTIDAKASGSAR